MVAKRTLSTYYQKNADYWDKYLFPVGIPLLLALALGASLALVIHQEQWTLIFTIPFLVPIALLCIRYPFTAIILWLMILPFIPPKDDARYLYWIFHLGLIPGTLGLILLARMFRLQTYPTLRLGWPELAMVAYLATAVASTLLTAKPEVWSSIILALVYRTGIAFAAFWLIRVLRPGPGTWQRLIMPYLLIFFIAEATIGLISGFSPQSLPEIWLQRKSVGERGTGTFTGAADYASTLMWLTLFLLHYGMVQKSKAPKIFGWLLFGLGLVCIFLSFNRASWLSSLLILLLLVFVYPKPVMLWVSLFIPVALFLTTTIPALQTQASFAYTRLTSQADWRSAEMRVVLTDAGMQMFAEKPLFGWGYTQYDDYDWQFLRRVGEITPNRWAIHEATSHNTFVTILAETGLAGFFFYYFPFLWWLIGTVKVWPRLPRDGFWSRKLLLITWLAISFRLLLNLTTDQRFSWVSTTMLWILLAVVATIVTTAATKLPLVAPLPDASAP